MKKLLMGLGFAIGGYLLYKKMTAPQVIVTSDNTSANYISADVTSAGDSGGAGPMRLMAGALSGLRRPTRMS